VVVYAQRAREAYPDANIVIGSIEASLRRIAHYDHWSEKVRRSVLPDSKADLLIFGSGERAVIALAHRLAAGEPIEAIRDLRGTAFMVKPGWHPEGWVEIDSTLIDRPGPVEPHPDPYAMEPSPPTPALPAGAQPVRIVPAAERVAARKADRARQVIRLPAYEVVKDDKVMYAHASRTFHLESNPGNARAMVQAHGVGPGCRDVWLNPPPIPLTTEEMDWVFGQPYARRPHPSYGEARIPAWDMIRFSINIMRGCFGGCTFCSITEHEGRIIQSRSEASILKEIEEIRDKTPGFTGTISDLGGPTANMYRMACKDPKIESSCRRLSCVFPGICENLGTDHGPLIRLYRKARAIPGVKKVLIGSGLRYDLAVRSPEYVKELVTHHVGGLLKIAPSTPRTAPRQDDEAGHRHLRPLQGDVRAILERGRQEAAPDPLLHRRPPGHHRRGHGQPGPVAEGQRLQARPGADLHADPDGHGHHHVPLGQEPAAQGVGRFRGGGHPQVRPPAPPPQGAPALPRPRGLAADPRGPAGHGPRRPDRRLAAPPGAAGPAGGPRPRAGRRQGEPGRAAQVGRQVRQPGGFAAGAAGQARRPVAGAFLTARPAPGQPLAKPTTHPRGGFYARPPTASTAFGG
jgi:uncharacterized radical SAM protein YgiQ